MGNGGRGMMPACINRSSTNEVVSLLEHTCSSQQLLRQPLSVALHGHCALAGARCSLAATGGLLRRRHARRQRRGGPGCGPGGRDRRHVCPCCQQRGGNFGIAHPLKERPQPRHAASGLPATGRASWCGVAAG
jgi:hypothetical protein